jgi:hypothetical protein
MIRLIFASVALLLATEASAAGNWVKVRGRTSEEAFYAAQEKYGAKFVKRGSCGLKQDDGYYYCDALIAD